MSPSRPTLNYDILLEVMQACSRSDCARFMRTCQFFYRHGFKALLAHPIYISSNKDVLERLAYLRKEGTNRFRHVRSLHYAFCARALTEATALELAKALPSMSKLEELHVTNSQAFVRFHPDLPAAVTALTSLRYLTLTYMDHLAIEMLQAFRSKLITVSVDLFPIVAIDRMGFSEDYHPTAVLAHSQSTLQDIHIGPWYEFEDYQPEQELTFPETRRLLLQQPLSPPRAMQYINTYPNLSELVLRDNSRYTFERSYNCDQIPVFRTWNIFKQVDSGPSAWDSLRRFKGSLFDLYILGLTCLIDEVHLHNAGPHELHWIGPVLSYARPVRLKLSNWPGRLHDPDVSAALRGQGRSRLEKLDMEAKLSAATDQDVDIGAVLEGMLSALSGSALSDLQMYIDTRELDLRPFELQVCQREECAIDLRSMRPGCSPPLPGPTRCNLDNHPLTFAEVSANAFDIEDYARRFVDAVPTLQRVKLVLLGPRSRDRRVTLTDGNLLLDEDWCDQWRP